MFLGRYIHNLDEKGRLTVPAKYRDTLAVGLVITRSPAEHCLLLMPQVKWDEVAAQISALPLTHPDSALLRRAVFTFAEDLKPDGQGRILISQRLREHAQIESEVLIAGVNTYVELWNPTLWDEKVMGNLNSEAILSQSFSALNI